VTLRATVPAAGSSLRLEGFCAAGLPAATGSPGTLVIRLRGAEDEHTVALEALAAPDGDARLWFAAAIDIDARPELGAGTWDLYIDSAGAPRRRLASSTGPTVGTTHVYPLALGTHHEVRAYVTVAGNVSLTVRPRRSFAEVHAVWPRDVDASIEGRVVHPTAASGATNAQLILRDRLSEDEIGVPATIEGDRFAVRVELAALSGLHRPDKQVWDLWLRVDGIDEDLHLGSHLDDIKNKKKVITFPAQTSEEGERARRFRVYYTVGNDLAMTSNRIALDSEQPARVPAPTPVADDVLPS
jgi:hypothetical protein